MSVSLRTKLGVLLLRPPRLLPMVDKPLLGLSIVLVGVIVTSQRLVAMVTRRLLVAMVTRRLLVAMVAMVAIVAMVAMVAIVARVIRHQ